MSKYFKFYLRSWLMLLFSLTIGVANSVANTQDDWAEVAFGEAQISVGEKHLTVEYAHNFDQRARGLMYRTDMCTDCGMLFEFEYPRYAGFWMKNTLLKLDIAYIDADGVITDIKPMYPLNLTSVPSSKPVQFALEMNQGWFANNSIKVGDSVRVLERHIVK